MSTIWISQEAKDKMNKIKIHPRETYEDIVLRLLEEHKKNKK
jgi:hypothetical protein